MSPCGTVSTGRATSTRRRTRRTRLARRDPPCTTYPLTHAHSHEARKHSYELVAAALAGM